MILKYRIADVNWDGLDDCFKLVIATVRIAAHTPRLSIAIAAGHRDVVKLLVECRPQERGAA